VRKQGAPKVSSAPDDRYEWRYTLLPLAKVMIVSRVQKGSGQGGGGGGKGDPEREAPAWLLPAGERRSSSSSVLLDLLQAPAARREGRKGRRRRRRKEGEDALEALIVRGPGRRKIY